jgi:hypothetical protein
MCRCEDRPCCGHLAEERADDAYWAERAYYGEDDFFDEDFEEETGDFYERQTSWDNRD